MPDKHKKHTKQFDENKIPYAVMMRFAQYNADLKKIFQHANKLTTPEDILNYVRDLKKNNGQADEYAQFLILATHPKTIAKYPFLHDYINTEGYDIIGHSTWDEIKKGIDYEHTCQLACGIPFTLILSIASLCFFSIAVNKVSEGDVSLESAVGTLGSAIVGGITLFGAKVCATGFAKHCTDRMAVNRLCNSLRKMV